MDHATAPAVCVTCHHPIPAWDTPRHACTGCVQRCAQQLAELPQLYAQLDPAPGRSAPTVGSRSGGAGARPPVRLDVVDLTAAHGVLGTLVSWMRCWAEDGAGDLPQDWPATPPARVAEACRWLRWRLDWAARRHPAVDDAMREIGYAHRQVHAAATGERGESRVAVRCPCGGVLRVGASTPGATCPRCAEWRGRAEVLRLPLAHRVAA